MQSGWCDGLPNFTCKCCKIRLRFYFLWSETPKQWDDMKTLSDWTWSGSVRRFAQTEKLSRVYRTHAHTKFGFGRSDFGKAPQKIVTNKPVCMSNYIALFQYWVLESAPGVTTIGCRWRLLEDYALCNWYYCIYMMTVCATRY